MGAVATRVHASATDDFRLESIFDHESKTYQISGELFKGGSLEKGKEELEFRKALAPLLKKLLERAEKARVFDEILGYFLGPGGEVGNRPNVLTRMYDAEPSELEGLYRGTIILQTRLMSSDFDSQSIRMMEEESPPHEDNILLDAMKDTLSSFISVNNRKISNLQSELHRRSPRVLAPR